MTVIVIERWILQKILWPILLPFKIYRKVKSKILAIIGTSYAEEINSLYCPKCSRYSPLISKSVTHEKVRKVFISTQITHHIICKHCATEITRIRNETTRRANFY